MRRFYLFILVCLSCFCSYAQSVLIETELFQNKGGWLVETQFVNQMGSPYLMAHGLGNPVEDAFSTVKFEQKGKYHIWVRTKDWAPFPVGPGRFELLIDSISYGVFGATGLTGWKWYYGGEINIFKHETEVRLHDFTGFSGRCDAIYFTKSKKAKLPETITELEAFRNKELNLPVEPHNEGIFDLVVVGGGVAGICTAVQASRLGLRVALINNRPVLGGCSSSEIRVPTDGDYFNNKYPALGRIGREIDNYVSKTNYRIKTEPEKEVLYGDEWRKKLIINEKNIVLFENMHINKVHKEGSRIKSVRGVNLLTLENHLFSAGLFVDCTGDGDVGLLAGADHRYGRENQEAANESLAPLTADSLTMGSSNQWYSVKTELKSNFPIEEWMLQFSDEYHLNQHRSYFDWETGFGNFHIVDEAEEIRDHNLRVIFGNWAYLKTRKAGKWENYQLEFVAHVTGKRESYRLLGDIILNQNDIDEKRTYPDAIVTTNWGIDLHYPQKRNSKYFPNREFISYAGHHKAESNVYTFPYRCLYSRNIDNLFMAGRNISVTHVALGAVRVQRCTAMMGEVVGLAAFLCVKNRCMPRDIYQKHLNELLAMVEVMDPSAGK
jgi:hypothetical protein